MMDESGPRRFPVVDVESALEHFGLDRDTFRRAARAFPEVCKWFLRHLEQAISQQDSKLACNIAFAFGLEVGRMGAAHALETVLALERTARAGNMEEATHTFQRLLKEVLEINVALRSLDTITFTT